MFRRKDDNMTDPISRKERLYERLKRAANNGEWGVVQSLYKSEEERFSKQWGVRITFIAQNTKDMRDSAVSWSDAFEGKELTLQQSEYISGWLDERPQCETFAEELYLETMRYMALKSVEY